jgi:hypothetical protein
LRLEMFEVGPRGKLPLHGDLLLMACDPQSGSKRLNEHRSIGWVRPFPRTRKRPLRRVLSSTGRGVGKPGAATRRLVRRTGSVHIELRGAPKVASRSCTRDAAPPKRRNIHELTVVPAGAGSQV